MLANSKHVDNNGGQDSSVDFILWDGLRHGNRQNLEEIYKSHVDNLYHYGILIFKDKAIVEDAIQDVFVELWRRREFLGTTTCIKFYLRKALKRNIVRKLETKERLSARHTLPQHYNREFIHSPEEDTIFRQSSEETSQNVWSAIKSLPEKQREIIIHKFYENLTSQEIANIMSITLDSVYTQISRAVNELKNRVSMK